MLGVFFTCVIVFLINIVIFFYCYLLELRLGWNFFGGPYALFFKHTGVITQKEMAWLLFILFIGTVFLTAVLIMMATVMTAITIFELLSDMISKKWGTKDGIAVDATRFMKDPKKAMRDLRWSDDNMIRELYKRRMDRETGF